ncbi:MAG: hypothetical protein KGN79_12175 [Acidobacteriota bacterium]|nr:hypothetical protein [Acidobacteriota bacterium]
MRRALLLFTLGIFGAFLAVGVVSVYVFHDVDKGMASNLNGAFVELCEEGVLFTLLISGGVSAITSLGRLMLRLKSSSPRPKLALILGIGTTVLQYPWDYAGRVFLPQFADTSLLIYLVLAVVACTITLLADTWRQSRRQALHFMPGS